ncbi:hypothetical protein DAEQUDRAFT_813008 [Daedalea quercina L-15889]|uniref:Alcohol dehydrogenase-like C-terminal domain-containing protein n=1 Tax=Daedalea quercina L-15889 TaxID=1314783 RepID=A0A165NSE6_9APHY|nr:hypothetical protein DAEQUDRAFT_813008 [Daedalea quercina L-15889]
MLPADAPLATVKTVTGGAPVKAVFDAMSHPDIQNLGYAVLAPGGTQVIDLPPEVDAAKRAPEKRVVMAWGYVNLPVNRELGAALYAKLGGWLADGTIKLNRVEVLPRSFEGIVSGLKKHEKDVSIVKLVIHPQETT